MIESLSLITDSHLPHPATAILSQAGYDVNQAPSIANVHSSQPATHAIIIPIPFQSLANWSRERATASRYPVLWWCDEANSPSLSLKDVDVLIDGVLFASMSVPQLQWSILIAASQFIRQQELIREREHLQLRLEERKWIEQAKGILCELKKISEEQAYQFLRQQAMNERKKMVDVARSIVHVYRLIHG